MDSEFNMPLLASLINLTPFTFFLDTIANKLHLQKINDFVLSPGPQSYKGVSMFQELRVDLYLLDFISAPTSMYLTQV